MRTILRLSEKWEYDDSQFLPWKHRPTVQLRRGRSALTPPEVFRGDREEQLRKLAERAGVDPDAVVKAYNEDTDYHTDLSLPRGVRGRTPWWSGGLGGGDHKGRTHRHDIEVEDI